MTEVEIIIGGRPFHVACREGEEHFLRSAAKMLDGEAAPLVQQMGRMPESKMLLMAGLMLADRTAALDDQLREAKARIAELEARPKPAAERVEVPVVPAEVTDTLAEIAARAEALADRVAEKTGATA